MKKELPKAEGTKLLSSAAGGPQQPALRDDEQDLLQHAPAGAVISAWGAVERAISTAAQSIRRSQPFPTSVRAMAKMLRDAGAIEEATFNAIQALQKMRNLVVHGGGEAREGLDPERAREFVTMAEAIEKIITLNVHAFKKNHVGE